MTDDTLNFIHTHTHNISSVWHDTCRRGPLQCETTESCYCPWTMSSSGLNLTTAEDASVRRTDEKTRAEFSLGFQSDIHLDPVNCVRLNIPYFFSEGFDILEIVSHAHRHTVYDTSILFSTHFIYLPNLIVLCHAC